MINPTFSAATLIYIALTVFQIQANSAVADDRPNIVIIMSDDMGISDLGCFGGEIETPNLDQLAEKGIRFTNFYSENMCWVSRASMLTGIYHKTSMVKGQLNSQCVTIAESLRAAGYQTRMSGKWHLGGKDYSVNPVDRGFEEYYGILGGAASFFAPDKLFRNKTNVEHEYNDPDFYLTDSISETAVDFVKQSDPTKPLFLNVAYTAAHWPLHAKAKDVENYRGKYAMGWDKLRQQRFARMKDLGIIDSQTPLSPRHPNVPAWEDEPHKLWQQRRMEVYAAQVTSMDSGIGRVIEALDSTGRLENTLIFFVIDNGGCHVEYTTDRKGAYLPKSTRDGRPMIPGNIPHAMPGPENTYQSYGYGWANASNTPFRLFKQHDHEGGIRTPMIAFWPKGIKKRGGISNHVSHLIDLTPTILEVTQTDVTKTANRKPAVTMDGHSIWRAIQGEKQPKHDWLYFSHSKGNAVRNGDWKLVQVTKSKWELYNLAVDPTELQDRAAELPDRVAKMKDAFDDWRQLQEQRVKETTE